MHNLFLFTIESDNFFYNNEKYIYSYIVKYNYIYNNNKKKLIDENKIIKKKVIFFKFFYLKDFFLFIFSFVYIFNNMTSFYITRTFNNHPIHFQDYYCMVITDLYLLQLESVQFCPLRLGESIKLYFIPIQPK